MAYGEHELLERKIQTVEQISELRDRYRVIWVDVEGLGNAEIVAALGELFGLHPLALEDVLNTHQRAKVDEFGEHLFVIARMVSFGERLESEQLSLFVGPGFVVSLQDKPGGDSLNPVRQRIRKGQCQSSRRPPLISRVRDHIAPRGPFDPAHTVTRPRHLEGLYSEGDSLKVIS